MSLNDQSSWRGEDKIVELCIQPYLTICDVIAAIVEERISAGLITLRYLWSSVLTNRNQCSLL